MSLNVKIGSLILRTLAKPISKKIKDAAREHERFRRYCIGFAQGLHRIDMRLRLGLLQDTALIDKQIAKEREEEKRRASNPTVKTEAETKADEAAAKAKAEGASQPKPVFKPRIRPLSEAKAIEMGANFISEAFLFTVAVTLVMGEWYRGRRKASNQREEHLEEFQELSQKVEEKDKMIHALEAKVEDRDHRIDALEARLNAMEGSLMRKPSEEQQKADERRPKMPRRREGKT